MNTFTIDNILIESENHFLEANLQFDKHLTDLMLMEAQTLIGESEEKTMSQKMKDGIVSFFKAMGEWFKKIGNIIQGQIKKFFIKIEDSYKKMRQDINDITDGDVLVVKKLGYFTDDADIIKMLENLILLVNSVSPKEYFQHKNGTSVGYTKLSRFEDLVDTLKKRKESAFLFHIRAVELKVAKELVKKAKTLMDDCKKKLKELHKFSVQAERESKKAERDAKKGVMTKILNDIKDRLTFLRQGLGKEYTLINDCLVIARNVYLPVRREMSSEKVFKTIYAAERYIKEKRKQKKAGK